MDLFGGGGRLDLGLLQEHRDGKLMMPLILLSGSAWSSPTGLSVFNVKDLVSSISPVSFTFEISDLLTII